MDYEDDYIGDPSMNYKGFDLTDIEDAEVEDLKDKIDTIYQDMTLMRDFCNKFLDILDPNKTYSTSDKLNPVIYKQLLNKSVEDYGEEKGTEITQLILGKPQEYSHKVVMAKAKALLLSYERQFEDEENEPILPSEFEDSDLFKTVTKLSGGKNIFPDFEFS